MQLANPFIKLPFQFDVERMQSDLNAMPEPAWMAHLSGMKGNNAEFFRYFLENQREVAQSCP